MRGGALPPEPGAPQPEAGAAKAGLREPVSWLGSWYRYRQRDFLDGKPVSTRGISFDAFVQGYLQGKRPDFANVGSQATFLAPRPNGTAITHLFRYEDAERLDRFLEDRLGVALAPIQAASLLDLLTQLEQAGLFGPDPS